MILEVGNIIYYSYPNGTTLYRFAITRVTAKQAFAEINDVVEKKFRREFVGDWFHELGKKGRWDRTLYHIETPELKEKYYHQRLVHRVEKIKFHELTNDQLEKIIELAERSAGFTAAE